MRASTLLFLGVFASQLANGSAHAETSSVDEAVPPQPRQGYALELALNYGTFFKGENNKVVGGFSGGGFMLRLGEVFAPRFGAGVLIEGGGLKRSNGATATVSGLSIEGYHLLSQKLTLVASTGLGFVSVLRNDDPGTKTRGGLTALFGAGLSYDMLLTRSDRSGGFAVTPALTLRYAPTSKFQGMAAFLSVGIRWYSGIDKSRLVLSDTEAYKKD